MSKGKDTAEQVIQDFVRDFRLTDPNLFKVAYSPLVPSEVLILGENPGGDPEVPCTVANHKENYKHGEHDFVDENYLLAVKARDLFRAAFGRDGIDLLRSIPVTNVSFFRSPAQLPSRTKVGNRTKCRPYLWRIINIVNPRLIIANGMDVFRYLESHLNHTTEVDRVLPPPATGQNIYFRIIRGNSSALGGKQVRLVGFHHLSGYRWSRPKFADLAMRLKSHWPR